MVTLADVGEFRLIEEIIKPKLKKHGLEASKFDDCSYQAVSDGILAISADAGPKPLLQNLEEHKNDFRSAGWLAATATVSDIATSGAKPLFMTNCIEAPADMPLGNFEDLVDGFFEAVSFYRFKNGGGDIRQGKSLKITVFGVGHQPGINEIGRSGAENGDSVFLLGDAGEVMASYLCAKNGKGLSESELENLRFPKAQLNSMQSLAGTTCVAASSDTSDGLLGAIENICKNSKCGVNLVLSSKDLSESILEAANLENINPWNIFFCWGDWSVVVIVKKKKLQEFERVCLENRLKVRNIGVINSNLGNITACLDQKEFVLSIVRNENFIVNGFNSNFSGHLHYMLNTEIFKDVEQ